MPIQILEAEDGDMYRIFEITSLAFGTHEPFVNATYPNHWTPAGRVAGARRFKDIKHSDPACTYLKAVDDATAQIVGMAKWNVFDNQMPTLDTPDGDVGEHLDNEDEKAYQAYLAHNFFADRRDAVAMSKGNLAALDILAVDPQHQRKGIGGKLVEWGTKRADELNVGAIVESSVFGKGLYEKHGFVYTKQVVVHVPQRWAHLGGQEFAWLVRPKGMAS